MLIDFERYATDVMEVNDVYHALDENRPCYYEDEAADWYRRERCYNLEPVTKAHFLQQRKKKCTGITGSWSCLKHRLWAEG